MLTGLQPHRHAVHDQRAAYAKNVVPVQSLAQTQCIKTASFIANICVLQSEERTVFHDGWDQTVCGMNDATEQYLWDRDVVDQAERPVLEKKAQYEAFNEWEKQRTFPT